MKKHTGWKLVCVTLAMGMLVTPVSNVFATVVAVENTKTTESTTELDSTNETSSLSENSASSTQESAVTSSETATQSTSSSTSETNSVEETATTESSTLETEEAVPAPEELMAAKAEITKPRLEFMAQLQGGSWVTANANGEAGTAGGKISGLKLSVFDDEGKVLPDDSVMIQGYYSHLGWSNGKYTDGVNGISNSKENLEALRIKVNQQLQEKYSLYYRVYSSKTGWMGWTKDGETSGTMGLANPVEKIQVSLAAKNSKDLTKEPKALIHQKKAPVVS